METWMHYWGITRLMLFVCRKNILLLFVYLSLSAVSGGKEVISKTFSDSILALC